MAITVYVVIINTIYNSTYVQMILVIILVDNS